MPFSKLPVTMNCMTTKSRLHRLGALFGALLTASVGLTHVLAPPAFAAVPTLTLPGRLYLTPGAPMAFAGTDPISGDDRGLHVSGLTSDPNTCKQVQGNKYNIDGCARIQMALGNAKAGLLRIPGLMTPVDTNNDNKNDGFLTMFGSIVNQNTDPNALDSVLYHFNGNQTQIQATLAAMLFVPCQQQVGTLKPINPPPAVGSSPVEVDCGAIGGNPVDEPIYEETETLDSALPTLTVQAIHRVNNVDENSTGYVKLKIEGINAAPMMTAPIGPIAAPAAATTSVSNNAVDVVDANMCNFTICGLPYTNPGSKEADDKGLLVVWLSENNCGTFNVKSYNGFTILGGPTLPTVHDVIMAQTDLDLADVKQKASADIIAAQVESTLNPSALTINLLQQPSSASTNTKVFAGVASLIDIKYALSQIDYNAPTADATCHLNVAMSDLGNNGGPSSYVGSPFGPEKPFPADKTGDTVPFEVPNALADSKTIQFDVKDTHPDPTIDQVLPGKLGDPAGPNKPAVFKLTFNSAIDPASLDNTDFALQLNNAPGGTLGAIVPITPGLVYSVAASASADGTFTLTMPGKVYAAGHNNDASYVNDPPTYVDNSIDWDATSPTVTIDQKVGQVDPATVSPVRFTVKFSDIITTAPVEFTSSDVMLSGTAGATTATITQPDLLDLKTYEVAVSGMTQSGTVIATVKAGAIDDLALNLCTASTSTDNSITWNSVVADKTPPQVTVEQKSGQADPTSNSPIEFTATFSEPVTGLTNTDVQFSGSTVGGTLVGVVTGGPTVYNIAVTGMTTDGSIVASLLSGAAQDAASNLSNVSTSVDNTVLWQAPVVDSTPPDVTINQASAQIDPTSVSPVVFAVVFSESVTGFATGDVTLTGTAGATTATVAGSGANYSVSVSGMNQTGTVIAKIAASVAADSSANPNSSSTSTDNTVIFHYLVAIATPGGSASMEASSGSQLTTFTTANPSVVPPAGVTFPYGELSFSATTTAGSLVSFALTLPAPLTSYYKLNAGVWSAFTFDGQTGAQFTGNVITITIRDNGRGDSNPAVGIATDPGAPALVQAVETTTTTTATPTTTVAPAVATTTTTPPTTIAPTTTTIALVFTSPVTPSNSDGTSGAANPAAGSAGTAGSAGNAGSAGPAGPAGSTGTTGSSPSPATGAASGNNSTVTPMVAANGPASTANGATSTPVVTTKPEIPAVGLTDVPAAVGPALSLEGAPLSFTGSGTELQIAIALMLLVLGVGLLAARRFSLAAKGK
jgi:hypothetical protein